MTTMRLLDGCGYLIGEVGKFVGRHFDVVGEIEVGGAVKWHEVDVGVGDVDSDDCNGHFDTRTNLFKTSGHPFGEKVELGVGLVVEVKNIVHLLLGDTEDVASGNGVDVEEGKAMLALVNFVAGDFACNNLAEDGHN